MFLFPTEIKVYRSKQTGMSCTCLQSGVKGKSKSELIINYKKSHLDDLNLLATHCLLLGCINNNNDNMCICRAL